VRALSEGLLLAQQGSSISPAVRLTLSHGVDEVVLGRENILPIRHSEASYSHRADVVLDGSGDLAATDYRGWGASIGYGAVTPSGDEYSSSAPLRVTGQEVLSSGGKLALRLEMRGIPDMLSHDRASEAYLPADTDTKTVAELVRAVLGDSGVSMLGCFSHGQPYEVVFEGTDDLMTGYRPRDGFRIYMNGSRLSALKRLLDFTRCVARFGGDGAVHIYVPATEGAVYDYEYSLQGGHTFFSHASRDSLVVPNYVVVRSHPGDSPQYYGYASDAEGISAYREVRYQKYARLESDTQAGDIAGAILSGFRLEAQKGEAVVPLNCGAEVFDYVRVTDGRSGKSRSGNIGSLTRKYEAGQYTMDFSFGGWLKERELIARLEVASDMGLDFYRLGVKNLHAERIRAENMDVAELSAISADIGTVSAGTIKGVTFRVYGDRLEIYSYDGDTLRGYLEGIVGGVALRSVDGGDVTLDSSDDINLDPASGSPVRMNGDMRMNTGCAVQSTGDLEIDPDGGDVIPLLTSYDLGNATYYWDNIEYSDLIDRTPSPYFIEGAVAKLDSLTTHTSVKKREGHPDRVVRTFDRESLPPEVMVPVTQYDRDRAVALQNGHLERLARLKEARERYRAKLGEPSFAGERDRIMAGLEEVEATIGKLEELTARNPQPEPGISMNATVGLLMSAVRELSARVASLEGKTGG